METLSQRHHSGSPNSYRYGCLGRWRPSSLSRTLKHNKRCCGICGDFCVFSRHIDQDRLLPYLPLKEAINGIQSTCI